LESQKSWTTRSRLVGREGTLFDTISHTSQRSQISLCRLRIITQILVLIEFSWPSALPLLSTFTSFVRLSFGPSMHRTFPSHNMYMDTN
jgi:hypothetical protein